MQKIIEDLFPTEFELAQNYPNPFTDKTIIKYCIPEKMQVKLEVFDSNGYKVQTLVDEIKNSGTYKVEFDVKEFKKCEYFYKLETNNYFDIKKMVVLK